MVRRAAELIVLGSIAVLVARGWGLFAPRQPVHVVGPSMAPAYEGQHWRLTCAACGYPFTCNADESEDRPAAACPNCDYPQRETTAAREPGKRLLVDTGAYRRHWPKRWETIVFRSPLEEGNHCIKRVVGLPGESIEIRGGDLWVNGELVRKSLAEQSELALPVFDSRHQPPVTADLPRRWRTGAESSGWVAVGNGFRHRPPANSSGNKSSSADSSIDWLQYAHWRRLPRNPERSEPAPITDYGYYNGRRSQRLNDVSDLMLEAKLSCAGSGRLLFRADVGGEQYVVELSPQRGNGRLLHDGSAVPGTEFTSAGPLLAEPSRLVFSLIDRQVLLAIDGRLLLEHAWPPRSGSAPVRETSRPISIGADGLEVDIDHLVLWRDLYYTTPTDKGGRFAIDAPCQLGANEFFVLGDNSPVSIDSRSGWPQGGLSAGYLLGRPLIR